MENYKTTRSESYIRIVCTDDASPKYNRLQLMTVPPTFIELQPGNNILLVEEYPSLKYGFRQIDDYCLKADDATNEYNCGDVILVDLSHFDSTEMSSMDMMCCRMENLENIIFGENRIENVTSMESAFEWIAAKELDLTKINFSKVTNAEMMTYSKENLKVNLAGCDLSNVVKAEGIFKGVSQLNLDGAVLSDAVIEAMSQEEELGCEDLKELSMRGCDIRMIRAVLKSVLESGTDILPRVRVILDKESENQILTSIAPANSWIPKHRREWYITVTTGEFIRKDNEILELITKTLRKNNLIEDIYDSEHLGDVKSSGNYYPWEKVYSVGVQFPSILIKTFFDWELGIRAARCSGTYSFVVGNNYAAFSNNPKLKLYVPVLHKGFYTIEDALNALVEAGFNDLSNCRIIEIQYLDPTSLPEILHQSVKWTPLTDGKFNLSEEWEEKFKAILSKEKERLQSYIDQCLAKLSRTKFNNGEVCTDTDGNKHLINPSKIIKISPYQKDDKVFATLSLENNISLTIDLIIFTKELTGFVPADHTEIKGKKSPTEIHVPFTDLEEVFKSIEEAAVPIIEKYKEEMQKHTSVKECGLDDEDEIFNPDFDEE